VPATVYARPGRALIALGSWAPEPVHVSLQVNWEALGLDPTGCRLMAPPIKRFQRAARFDPAGRIPVPAGKGWLLILHTERQP
jgi:hypothetical protein